MSKIYADPNVFNERTAPDNLDRILLANKDNEETQFLPVGKLPFYKSTAHSVISRAKISINNNIVIIGDGLIFVDFKDGIRKSVNHTETTYTLSSGESLMYSRQTNSLGIRNNNDSSIAPDDVPLLVYDGVRGISGGELLSSLETSILHCTTRAALVVRNNTVTIGDGSVYITWKNGESRAFSHFASTYDLSGNKALVYNKTSSTLIVKIHAEIAFDDAILFFGDNVKGIVGGLLFEQYLKSLSTHALFSLTRASVKILGTVVTVGDGIVYTLFNDGFSASYQHVLQDYTLTSGGRLVHNRTTNKLAVRSSVELQPDDAVLLEYDGVKGINTGMWYSHYVLRPMIEQNTLNISQSSSVPIYVKEEWDNVIMGVNEYKSGKNVLVFGAICDTHIGLVEQYLTQMYWFAEVGKFRICDFVYHAGDVFLKENGLSKTQLYKSMHSAVKAINATGEGSIWTIGNHDDNGQAGITESEYVTKEMFYDLFQNGSRLDLVKPSHKSTYHYYDNKDHKIRFINMDTHLSDFANQSQIGIGNDQLNWLASVALDFSNKSTPEEWGVVLFSHASLRLDIGGWKSYPVGFNFQVAIDILKAWITGTNFSQSGGSGMWTYNIIKDFSTQGYNGEVLFSLHGHAHFDNHYKPAGEWMHIISTSSSYNAPELELADRLGDPHIYPVEYNTAKSTAFDIVLIDRSNGKVFFKRFGRGVDREITY